MNGKHKARLFPAPFALQDLKNKPKLREKFGIKDEWVLPFEVREWEGMGGGMCVHVRVFVAAGWCS